MVVTVKILKTFQYFSSLQQDLLHFCFLFFLFSGIDLRVEVFSGATDSRFLRRVSKILYSNTFRRL